MSTKVRALVVDDSAFFRRRLVEILNADPGIEVIDTAGNGEEAVAKVRSLKPDVVTMDIEMPVMDGISAVRAIMRSCPTPVLMFSSLTHEGATATLDALDAGAMDFLPKRFQDIASRQEDALRLLCQRVQALGRRRVNGRILHAQAPAMQSAGLRPAPSQSLPAERCKLVAIGASTGGPVALQSVLTGLPGDFPVPVLVVQHMPPTFTRTFAERLDQTCRIRVKEAEDGDPLEPATAYIAPGSKQMLLHRAGGQLKLRIIDGDASLIFRPCVDVTFRSIASQFGGDVLAIILTGMGADGREGVRELKRLGARVWAQDEASCVVYGMPQAVVNAGLADRVMAVSEIGGQLGRVH